jgi:hypothetical protein
MALTALAFFLPATPSLAHDAIGGWRYPIACCSDIDCFHLEPGEVTWTPAGYRIEATGEVISFEDTRRSNDGYFHRCSGGGKRNARTINEGDFYDGPGGEPLKNKRPCFWAPEAGA